MNEPKTFGGHLTLLSTVLITQLDPQIGKAMGTAFRFRTGREITHPAQIAEFSSYDKKDIQAMLLLTKDFMRLAMATETWETGRKFPTRIDLPTSAVVNDDIFSPESLAEEIVADKAIFDKLCSYIGQLKPKNSAGEVFNMGGFITQMKEFYQKLGQSVQRSRET